MDSRPSVDTPRPMADPSHAYRDQGERLADAAFRTFAFLWAAAAMFHYAAWTGGLVPPDALVVLPAAVAVLLRPSSVVRFVVLAGLQVATVVYFYPDRVSNHWLLAFFVNLTILIAAAHLAYRDRTVQPGRLFEMFAPALRLALLVLYFFAVFHKLNADFFNPAVSCATDLYTNIAGAWHLPIWNWFLALLPAATIVVEVAIPVLLVVRRTRVLGIALGMVFHSMLAFDLAHTYYDFSSTVYALYFVFLPYDYLGRMRDHWAGSALGQRVAAWHDRGLLRRAFTAFLVGILGIVAFSTAYQILNARSPFMEIEGSRRALLILNTVLWVIYAATLLVLFLRSARAERIADAVRGRDGFAPKPLLALIPLAMLLNGFSPYLGLKTEDSFAMFSNLQTEAGNNNHFLMSTDLRLTGFQDDLVRVVETSDRGLRERVGTDYLMTYFEFRRYLSQRPDASVTFVRGGERFTIPRVGDDPELSSPPPLWQSKLLQFRPVDTNEAGVRCIH